MKTYSVDIAAGNEDAVIALFSMAYPDAKRLSIKKRDWSGKSQYTVTFSSSKHLD